MALMKKFGLCLQCLEAGYRTAIGQGVRCQRDHGVSDECQSSFVWASVAYQELLYLTGCKPQLSAVYDRVRSSST